MFCACMLLKILFCINYMSFFSSHVCVITTLVYKNDFSYHAVKMMILLFYDELYIATS